MSDNKLEASKVRLTILVAALGYFVDIYDLQLFNIVGRQSLISLGIQDIALLDKYDYQLFLWQMGGMLAGGIFWGVIGDKKGRKNILFGSILLYSLANIANAFVVGIPDYCAIRFIAGLGLAGELGAAVTLINEIMDKRTRGYGTMIIVTMGALGAVAAALLNHIHIGIGSLANWQMSYLIGGGLGLLLLFLRFGTFESKIFNHSKEHSQNRGNFFYIFHTRERASRYILCILMGLPVWFSIGILIKFSKAFATNAGLQEPTDQSLVIMFAYIGLSTGDLISGTLSQIFKSRKKIIFWSIVACMLLTIAFLQVQIHSIALFYFMAFLIGTASGYWVVFVTMSSEQFGTNIRATVTTSIPNMVRGALVPIAIGFKSLEPQLGLVPAAYTIGFICLGLPLLSLIILKDSFGRDLDFNE
jgi:MFS family permease